MKKLITNMDIHGRVLIPSKIRKRLNLHPGDKINLEVHPNEVKIISANQIIDEMHMLFTKNQSNKKDSVVDDFINKKRQEYKIEEERAIKK